MSEKHNALEWVGGELSMRLSYVTLTKKYYPDKESCLCEILFWFSRFDRKKFLVMFADQMGYTVKEK